MTLDVTALKDGRNQPPDRLPETGRLHKRARRNGAATRRAARSLGVFAVTGLVVPLALHTAGPAQGRATAAPGYRLAALALPTLPTPATVLTLEAGLVGLQDAFHFTPLQLQGALCAAPNTCIPVNYPALPGQAFNELGADALTQAVAALPDSAEPIILMGYSEGGQVIYSTLRRWQADPSTAPDPSSVSWVSIGNPDNTYGGFQTKLGLVKAPLPADTPYSGIEVIRQYDGWADWPDDPTNLLAVLNAVVGMLIVHPNYTAVDLNDPNNVVYTPTLPDGTPGNVTYVWVPNPVLPLISGTGLLAPILDSILRPIVESAYDRPVTLPAPGASSPAPASTIAAPEKPTALDIPPSPTPNWVAVEPLSSTGADSPTRLSVGPTVSAPQPGLPGASATVDPAAGSTESAAATSPPASAGDPVARPDTAGAPAPSAPNRHRGAGNAAGAVGRAAANRDHRGHGKAGQPKDGGTSSDTSTNEG